MDQISHEVAGSVAIAIDHQRQANTAWLNAAEANEKAGGRWQVTLYCLQAAGISDEDIRVKVGGSPSTVRRWQEDLVQPPRKLRDALFAALFAHAAPLKERATLEELHTARTKPHRRQKAG